MELRNFNLDKSGVRRSVRALHRFDTDAEENRYLPHTHFPVLEGDFSDEEAFEPDGVNDFVHHLGAEELDQQ